MKKLHLLLLSVTLCVFSACHNDIWDAIDGLNSRVTKLEELCKEMNTNITSLQTIVEALQSNDFITSIVEIKKDGKVVGYTITFGKHDPITIYHGQDGKDGENGQNGADGKDGQNGQNGADGKDGITPVIGVAQDTDGVYYWTLNGEWLLDDNGNKLPVSGKDGQNGVNGTMPQLKIEEGYWYVSYDNGVTWTQLGKATGEDGKDGQNGADGKDGQDGDSMFQSVTQDDNYVYFTLADGTVIKIAMGSSNNQSNEDFIFTITYDPNGGEGVMEKDTFYYGYAGNVDTCTFKREGYYFSGQWNTSPNGTGASYKEGYSLNIDKNITLYAQWESKFSYVDLGLSVKWANCNIGANSPEEYGDYFAWGETDPKSTYDWSTYKWCNGSSNTQIKYCTNSSYGTIDNKTVLEATDDAATVNWGGAWRMPTDAEWTELREKGTWTWTTQNGVKGYKVTSKSNGKSIFLPAAGYREGSSLDYAGNYGNYWSSSLRTDVPYRAYCLNFLSDVRRADYSRYIGQSVRPVCP